MFLSKPLITPCLQARIIPNIPYNMYFQSSANLPTSFTKKRLFHPILYPAFSYSSPFLSLTFLSTLCSLYFSLPLYSIFSLSQAKVPSKAAILLPPFLFSTTLYNVFGCFTAVHLYL
ncbi:unnamed protein product [Ilex paraguariensis]|uniref:Uncharacterized protein n=1 Tax=Ilex paraguariensis TaxID=185542 RepID=A0ABC8S4E2_9AQUA